MKLLQLGGVLLYTVASLFSCTVATPAKNYTVHYAWQYNCVANPTPQAFEFGMVANGQLVKVGELSVSSCTSAAQQFQAASSKQKQPPASGSRFYVRAVFAGNTFSAPDFYVLP